jgi:hypothetical protein
MNKAYFFKVKRRILKFAKANKVDVIFVSGDDVLSNYYLKKQRRKKAKVVVSTNNSKNIRVCILLHELGHFQDSVKNTKLYNTANRTVNEHPSFYNGFGLLTKTQKRTLINAETRAWLEAELLAQELGINLGFWFFKVKEKHLKCLVKNWGVV